MGEGSVSETETQIWIERREGGTASDGAGMPDTIVAGVLCCELLAWSPSADVAEYLSCLYA